eukprot:TRINITY_DN6711_c1_g1_i1.p1 TRINITY_DN6711_c1_g1~~TRINITY_DN6711_c1_g1_i1.p1  ORF type:complete len:201 (+),score=21.13 TRINITY_DN6711_c1_g1_i1:50-604(+)
MIALLLLAGLIMVEGTPSFNGTSGAVWGGADVVEYWSLNSGDSGAFGSQQYNRSYGGYTFYFKNFINADLFEAAPDSYIPAWGGFDAWSFVYENHWRADLMGPPCNPTDSWFIYNQSLYCALTPYLRDLFLNRVNHSIVPGNDKWIGYYGSLNQGPINNACFQTNVAQCNAGNVTFQNRNSTIE